MDENDDWSMLSNLKKSFKTFLRIVDDKNSKNFGNYVSPTIDVKLELIVYLGITHYWDLKMRYHPVLD